MVFSHERFPLHSSYPTVTILTNYNSVVNLTLLVYSTIKRKRKIVQISHPNGNKHHWINLTPSWCTTNLYNGPPGGWIMWAEKVGNSLCWVWEEAASTELSCRGVGEDFCRWKRYLTSLCHCLHIKSSAPNTCTVTETEREIQEYHYDLLYTSSRAHKNGWLE